MDLGMFVNNLKNRSLEALLIAFAVLFISSCSSGRVEVSAWFVQSVNYFNKDKLSDAKNIAKEIARHNQGASQFLLTQYSVYSTQMTGSKLIGDDVYAGVSTLDLNDPAAYVDLKTPSSYRGEYVVAKVFAIMHEDGPKTAKSVLKSECWNWRGESSSSCLSYFMLDQGMAYTTTRDRLFAVSLFEASYIGGSKGLSVVNGSESDFYLALSLFDLKHAQAIDLLGKLRRSNLIDNNMSSLFCRIADKSDSIKTGIECNI